MESTQVKLRKYIRPLALSLGVIVMLIALLAVVAGGSVVKAAPAETAIKLTKTVGTTPGVCATTKTIQVVPGTTVYYCYTIENTGTTTVNNHTLVDSALGTIFANVDNPLAPGEVTDTVALGVTVSAVINASVDNTATWTVDQVGGLETASASDSASVEVVNPAITLTKTVGTTSGVCAATSTISVVPGTTVYYCYTVTNTGDVTLNLHDLQDDKLGAIFAGLNYALDPGASVNTVAAGLTISAVINETTVNSATWTAYNDDIVTATANATATVNVVNPAIQLSKTVSTSPVCGTQSEIMVLPNTPVYYCYLATNTGDVTLNFHQVVDDKLGPLVSFPAALPPGASGGFVWSPVLINETTTNTATWTAFNDAIVRATDTASATVRVVNPAIELVKTVGTDPLTCATTNDIAVGVGTDVVYCYTVTNTGDLTLPLHTLVDSELGTLLGPDFAYDLAPGASVFITQTATMPNMPGTVVNNATWTAYVDTVFTASATDTATVTVRYEADLAITKMASADNIEAGNILTYTLEVVNNGPNTAENVVVTDPLPAELLFGAVMPYAPTCTYSSTSHTVTCNLGNMAPGDTATITLRMFVVCDCPNLVVNLASVTSDTFDPDTSNNSDSYTTVVTCTPTAVGLADFAAVDQNAALPASMPMGAVPAATGLAFAAAYWLRRRR